MFDRTHNFINCYSFFRVVIGYDDLVYTTSTGNNVILQHGQSWTFECQYKLNGEGITNSTTLGKPGINTPGTGIVEIPFEMNFYSDDTYNQVFNYYSMMIRMSFSILNTDYNSDN